MGCCSVIGLALLVTVISLLMLKVTSTTMLHDCTVEADWKTAWTVDKQDYCCAMTGVACMPQTFATTTAPPVISQPPPPPQPAPTVAPALVRAAVPPPTPRPTPPPAAAVSAAAVPQGQPMQWPGQVATAGAATQAAQVECLDGTEDAWSPATKAWCCQMHSKGCDAAPAAGDEPYQCGVGLDNWQQGWSDSKKAWCCQHK